MQYFHHQASATSLSFRKVNLRFEIQFDPQPSYFFFSRGLRGFVVLEIQRLASSRVGHLLEDNCQHGRSEAFDIDIWDWSDHHDIGQGKPRDQKRRLTRRDRPHKGTPGLST